MLTLLALVITLGASAYAQTPDVSFGVSDFDGIPKSGYKKLTSTKNGITITATCGSNTSLDRIVLSKSDGTGNWFAVTANTNAKIDKIVVKDVNSAGKNGATLVVYANNEAYNITTSAITSAAGTNVINENISKGTDADKTATINDSFFVIYNGKKGGSTLTFSSVDIYLDKTPADPKQPAAPSFNPDGGEVDMNTIVSITGDEKTQSLKYWFDDEEATTVTGATATVTIAKACTLNAIAIGEGGVESSTKSVSFTLAPVKNTYKKVTVLTSGKYVFMCGDNFVNPALSGNRCNFTTDFTKTGDEVEALDKYEFTITVDADNMATIQGPDGNYYGMSKANTVFASVANADNSCNWTYTVNADGQVIFTNTEYPTYTIAQHMGSSNPYNNMAPGIYKDGAVYPTLYKLVVAPAAPELDGVEITDGKITGDKLTFKVVEGVSVWYKIETETVANAPAREVNAEGYTKYEGEPITLTNNMKSVTYYAEDNATGAKSEPVTYAIDFLSGIAGIEAEAGEAVYYNLQGVRVENPAKGLYIRVANGKSQKVIM